MLKKHINNRKNKSNYLIFLPVFTFIIISFLYFLSTSYNKSWNFKWKGISSQVKDTVFELEKNDIAFNCSTQFGLKIQQWYRQKWFKENASDKELLKLTKYPNGTIKALSYETLLERNKVNKYKLLKQSLNDSITFVHYTMGCMGNGMLLGEYLVKLKYQLGEYPKFPKLYNLEKELTKKELTEILEIYSDRKLKEQKYKELYYSSIK